MHITHLSEMMDDASITFTYDLVVIYTSVYHTKKYRN